MDKLPKIALPAIAGIIVLIIFISKSAVTIGSGEAGVLYKTFGGGVVTDEPPLDEGFHIVAPWNKVFVYEVRQQEQLEKMNVLSSNGLDIKLEASVWFQPKYSELGKLHQEKSEQYIERVLLPAIRSAARSVVGRYTPEQLYSSKRDAIQQEIFEETQKIVAGQYIQLNEVLVRDVTLPPTIKDAIERKLKQEQESLEYEFRLVTAQKEAEKVRIEAQGKADANRILSASLTDKILQDKGIEATLMLAQSPNTKVVVVGSGNDGLPLILGNN
ncbi:prohibitin family protein [Flagellimonas taeanensis]|jgi:regulator of protease activity HflC (stomatin/prohibitin superfamily)|uniref:Regulator of protease activity HflC, stomatin/prohibitin superfamily n=1 Tax=Flagellimonas taeanensis TaxID=1005926 RepID=A0A1M7A1W4_9FLAO|nr:MULTISPECIES: prohibitin family protein [Allomuricauda]MDC6386211.1 prohibitin family protein [Muricauda sp. SK9]MEE1963382.1 prohibitin family protein [Allomuricauda taeanensis]RIV48110.1 prohibitin family protein [Allomuricauda taeanensis]SFC26890.1 Regulator of protease activity HflC, stomatin/prohibitin superfamily [Allomuricauda taeanensis]SHL36533.1 Regulator of protease activity HflC, stomatin/prohibitin superfamily [Allomuricauda taeanensis]